MSLAGRKLVGLAWGAQTGRRQVESMSRTRSKTVRCWRHLWRCWRHKWRVCWVESVLDLSRHVEIDLARFRPGFQHEKFWDSCEQVADPVKQDESLVENPGFRPGFRPARLTEFGLNVMIFEQHTSASASVWSVFVSASHNASPALITTIIIPTTISTVLSSWLQGHCESSLGSSGECRTAPSSRRPSDQATWLGLWVRL